MTVRLPGGKNSSMRSGYNLSHLTLLINVHTGLWTWRKGWFVAYRYGEKDDGREPSGGGGREWQASCKAAPPSVSSVSEVFVCPSSRLFFRFRSFSLEPETQEDIDLVSVISLSPPSFLSPAQLWILILAWLLTLCVTMSKLL